MERSNVLPVEKVNRVFIHKKRLVVAGADTLGDGLFFKFLVDLLEK